MFEHRQMQQSDNTKPTFFLRPAQNVQKIMTLIVTVDCLIVFSYLISKIRVQGRLIADGKGKFRKYLVNLRTFTNY